MEAPSWRVGRRGVRCSSFTLRAPPAVSRAFSLWVMWNRRSVQRVLEATTEKSGREIKAFEVVVSCGRVELFPRRRQKLKSGLCTDHQPKVHHASL